jgi:hypothetical protein
VRNPFKFGDPVSGEYYFPLNDLSRSVLTFLNDQINVVILGPRRFGKTSFINQLLREQKFAKTAVVVDLFNVTDHQDFYRQLTMAIAKQASLFEGLQEWFKRRKLKLSAAVDADGKPEWSLSTVGTEADVRTLILEALQSLAASGERVLVAFDEFQSIADLDDDGWLEASLRTAMQTNKSVSFVFSGSRKSIIHDMFNNPARPFYASCQLIHFPVLPAEFSVWLSERFKLAGISASVSEVDYLRGLVRETPNYVQQVCYHLVADGVKEVTPAAIDETLKMIVKRNAYAYQTLLRSLTGNQQKVLRMAARVGSSVYSREVYQQFGIKTGAHVSQAVNALKKVNILDEDSAKGVLLFDDPLFALWLKTEES